MDVSDAIIISAVGAAAVIIPSYFSNRTALLIAQLNAKTDAAAKQRDKAAEQQQLVAARVQVVAEKQTIATAQVAEVKNTLANATASVAAEVKAVGAQVAHDKKTLQVAAIHQIEQLEEVKHTLAANTEKHRRHDDLTEQTHAMANGTYGASLMRTLTALKMVEKLTMDPAAKAVAHAKVEEAQRLYDEHHAHQAVADEIPKRRAGDQ